MAATAGSEVSDGPVLSLINKRIRALRKKQNRIHQMEESLAQGKSLNNEQLDVLHSQTAVSAAIDELEKLRQPLSAAVAEEITLAVVLRPWWFSPARRRRGWVAGGRSGVRCGARIRIFGFGGRSDNDDMAEVFQVWIEVSYRDRQSFSRRWWRRDLTGGRLVEHEEI